MLNPKFKTPKGLIQTHDIVVANPMWNQPFNPDIFTNDPFDRFRTMGGATSGKGTIVLLNASKHVKKGKLSAAPSMFE